MTLLMLFAFVAGAATALSPCVLPVLPVALAAGTTGGRLRPLGVVVGLVLSFTVATVALVYLLSALGLPDALFRTLAIVVLAVAGVALIVPGAVFTNGKPKAGNGVDASLLGTVKRRDGKLQVTYAGRPLYFYAHERPGEVKCHNVNLNGGFWWVVGPDGERLT